MMNRRHEPEPDGVLSAGQIAVPEMRLNYKAVFDMRC